MVVINILLELTVPKNTFSNVKIITINIRKCELLQYDDERQINKFHQNQLKKKIFLADSRPHCTHKYSHHMHCTNTSTIAALQPYIYVVAEYVAPFIQFPCQLCARLCFVAAGPFVCSCTINANVCVRCSHKKWHKHLNFTLLFHAMAFLNGPNVCWNVVCTVHFSGPTLPAPIKYAVKG